MFLYGNRKKGKLPGTAMAPGESGAGLLPFSSDQIQFGGWS